MGIFRGPNIVRSGLVLALDAGSERSYPGTGNIWYDLSGNGNNHSINGSPIFQADEFIITESNSFSTTIMPTTNTQCTVVLIYKTTDIQELWVRGQTGSYYIAASHSNGNYYHQNSGTPSYYIDNRNIIKPNTSTVNGKDGNYHIFEAKGVDFSNWNQLNWFGYGSSWNMNGTLSSILVYDRNITESESTQNFNAKKSRYGL